jgi:hypothetical protein
MIDTVEPWQTCACESAYAHTLLGMAVRVEFEEDVLAAFDRRGTDPVLGSVRVFGQDVDVVFRWDTAELDRRRAVGLEAVTSCEALRALSGLPAGLPVAASRVDPCDRLVLSELPPGAVDEVGSDVIRQLVPPVQLIGIAKEIDSWEDVQGLTLLRTHAPRLAIAHQPLARRIATTCDPDLGLAVASLDGLSIERPPGSRWIKPSWQRWLLAETVMATVYDRAVMSSNQS